MPPSLIHSLPSIAAASTQPGLPYYQDRTLFHGASFRGIEQIFEIQETALTMECYLPKLGAKQQGQFPADSFNPYLADVLIQSLLVWLKERYQVGALPTEIQQITQFKPLPFDRKILALMEAKVKTEANVIYNVTACDQNGEVYVHLSGVKATISDRLSQLFKTLVPLQS
jgi:Polyketide synthase dehydratase